MKYHRPKTRGELRDKLSEGIDCEVVSYVSEMTETMLRGWLNFEDFIAIPSGNEGWTLFKSKLNNKSLKQEGHCCDQRIVRHCANCRWGMDLEHRYDQVHCINEDSKEAFSDVEATFTCPLFEENDQGEARRPDRNQPTTPKTYEYTKDKRKS